MRYLKIFVAVISIGLLSSCSKSFLEVDPKGRIIAKQTKDYRNLFYNGTLLAMGFSDFQMFLGDEVVAMSSFLNSESLGYQRAFRWADDLYDEETDAPELNSLMAQIYLLNKIINEVMTSERGTDAEKEALRAEARATRAWSFFQFINYYGKPYDPATASADPGVPIVLQADATLTEFRRSSVQEVYDFIIKEINESMPLLPRNNDARSRMTQAGAEALLGKVYMFMGKFQQALPLLENAFSHLPDANLPLALYDYNTLLAPGGSWYFPTTVNSYIGAPLPWASTETLFSRQYSSLVHYQHNVLLLKKEVYDLFGANDMRRLFYTRRPAFSSPGTEITIPGAVRKYAPTNVVAIGIGMPELYLLRAECYARTGELDKAITDLETLRSKRMPAQDAEVTITDQNELIRFVIEERLREFAFTGFRWFDMRRLSVDPLFAAQTYEHVLYNAAGNEEARFQLKKDRYTLRFPLKVMNQNPGMKNNP
ncbi:MAG: RagB/SusD family nutrient uptake outer membrane protein [Pseudobacter sp.]|uniref:RagB/SusD family nutrient uptake outer membrane protein n=1 Tax=Pseudobacter sp. TaxID=2045420 RepID=UPI003F7F07ED